MKVVAIIESMTAEQDKKFIKFIESKKWGYWHWIDGAWLIQSTTSYAEVETVIRDEIQKIAPKNYTLVFSVEVQNGWSGFGPSGETKNMFTWIKNYWTNK